MTRIREFQTRNYYHIYFRSVKSSSFHLFRDFYDYEIFLKYLFRLNRKFNNEIIQYSLLHNHVHLLIKPSKKNSIPKHIGALKRAYVQCFQAKYKHRGTIYQGRYKTTEVVGKQSLLRVSVYIHLNAYKHGLTRTRLESLQYVWSSGPYYIDPGSHHKYVPSSSHIMKYFKTNNEYIGFCLNKKLRSIN